MGTGGRLETGVLGDRDIGGSWCFIGQSCALPSSFPPSPP